MRKVVIGSRESKLAVVQSEMVRTYIQEHAPSTQVEILTMKTTGQVELDHARKEAEEHARQVQTLQDKITELEKELEELLN